MVGSTALVRLDETLAHQRTQDVFRRFSDVIAGHHGIAQEIRGDALVAEFARVSDAVAASVDFQARNAAHNAELFDDVRPVIRVGIAMGEVVVADNTVTGEGVVIAQRLEQLAEPGGVCIQDAAYQTVPKRLPFDFENLGEHELKGFAEPVRALRVLSRSVDQRGNPADSLSGTLTALEAVEQLRLPEKPSVAVVPFKNLSGDPEEEYFSDGITDGVINGLTRFRDLFVMGRSSSFSFRDKDIETTELGRKLGVEYLVQGSVRKRGDRIRINTELVDAASGRNLWAERYDRELGDIFSVEDEVTATIVATLALRVEDAAHKRSERRPPENLAAYDWLLRGTRFLERGGKEDLPKARQMFERAIELEPDFAAAYAGMAKACAFEYLGHYAEDQLDALSRSLEFARKAVALDGTDSRGHYALGCAYFFNGQQELAEFHAEQAIELNPSEYHNICLKGWVLSCTDRHEESTTCLTDSLRCNPYAPDSCYFALGIADYVACKYQGAVVAFTRLSGDLPRKLSCLAASSAQLGRESEAHAAAAEFRKLVPELPGPGGNEIAQWREHWSRLFRFMDPEPFEHLLEGLRKAGLPA